MTDILDQLEVLQRLVKGTRAKAFVIKVKDEIVRLRRLTDERPQHTHSEGCWEWGPRHYDCAVAYIDRLKREVK